MPSCGPWEPPGPSCLAVGSLLAGVLALDGSWGPSGPVGVVGVVGAARAEWDVAQGPWRQRSPTQKPGRPGGGARGLSR